MAQKICFVDDQYGSGAIRAYKVDNSYEPNVTKVFIVSSEWE